MEFQAESMLVDMIRYNNWANGVLLEVCGRLEEDTLDASAPGVYGTIRDTLLHMVWAEADYVNRITGVLTEPKFRRGDRVTAADLAEFQGRVAEVLLDTVGRVPPEQLVREEEEGQFIEYTARLLYLQVVNHGIEHRTNVTTVLSGLGIETPEIDGWGYLFSQAERFQLKEGKVGE